MWRINTTSRFERMLGRFVKAHPDLRSKVRGIMRQLARDPMRKSHALGGTLKGCRAASITYSYRVVFYLESDEIWFISIGSHDEVY